MRNFFLYKAVTLFQYKFARELTTEEELMIVLPQKCSRIVGFDLIMT
jgi:hypothetical protein